MTLSTIDFHIDNDRQTLNYKKHEEVRRMFCRNTVFFLEYTFQTISIHFWYVLKEEINPEKCRQWCGCIIRPSNFTSICRCTMSRFFTPIKIFRKCWKFWQIQYSHRSMMSQKVMKNLFKQKFGIYLLSMWMSTSVDVDHCYTGIRVTLIRVMLFRETLDFWKLIKIFIFFVT